MKIKRISFSAKNNLFYDTLKQKVENYFASNKLKPTGNWKLYSKTIILLISAIAIYLSLLIFPLYFWIALPLCALLGLNLAGIGFNVMHDGAHGSYAKAEWLNEMMAYSLNAMGGSSYLWKVKHNFNHHSFTNIEGMDDDIDIKPWMRTNENQKRYWFHRYQHIYWVLFYSLTYLFWIFFADFKKYFSNKVSDMKFRKMNVKEHFIFWVSKIVYFSIAIAVPAFVIGFWQTILGFLVLSAVCGLTLGIVFQMAHIVEHTNFDLADESNKKIEKEWAVHQINTTANFATKSKIISWFTGGLNFQVEHHLFPRISHVHYPAISKFVKETCEQFKVKYIEYPTFLSALYSHILYLKAVGVK